MSTANNNKCKRKILTQRHACSRMNFLYQAANLMAQNNHSTLAAYYGKLCRNVGTKTLMHMSPGLKRTLCKRCSLPLLPGVNTTLQLEKESPQQQTEKGTITEKPRTKSSQQQVNDLEDNRKLLQLECRLCQAKRRFQLNTNNNECWLEREAAIVQTVTLNHPTTDNKEAELR